MTSLHHTTTEQHTTPIDRTHNWRFVLLWITATTLPLLVGFPILRLISGSNTVPGTWRTVVLVLPFFTQWIVLLSSMPRLRWWLLPSIGGLVLGGIVASVVRVWFRVESPIVVALLQGLSVGVILGLLQGLLLRRVFSAAIAWLVVSVLAWGSAFTITWWGSFTTWTSDPSIRLAVIGTVMGLTYSIPTGLTLSWLSRRHAEVP